MQAATIATTSTSVSKDKLAGQLSKWWDIESYGSNCDVNRHLRHEQRANKQELHKVESSLFTCEELPKSELQANEVQ